MSQKNVLATRGSGRPYERTWEFRVLHIAALAVTVPIVAVGRVLPGHHDESVFVQANRNVLTALGFAFMA